MTQMNSIRMGRGSRAEFRDPVDADDLLELATNPKVKVLQCCYPVRNSVWQLVNESFFARRPDVELRVYRHYSTVCDLRFASQMSNVRRFAADCLMGDERRGHR
jgi:hypothetical protein